MTDLIEAAQQHHSSNSIYSTPKKKDRDVMPMRPRIIESTLSDGTTFVYDAWAVHNSSKTFLRRYTSREEATAAVLEYIRTGEKPERKTHRESVKAERKATLRPVRRTVDGEERWDVTGREGRGKQAVYKIPVGTFLSRSEAEEHMRIFEATGETFCIGRRRPTSKRQKARPTRTATSAPKVIQPPAAENPRLAMMRASLRRVG